MKFTAWQSAATDNGWGGYVAEQLLASKAPVNVIFPAGTDTLSLVTEVLDLIPIPQRWGVTFSTYFTKLLAGTECQLRFYLDGTTEATALRNDARALKVDLAGALAPAEGGKLVETARSGVLEFKQAATKKQEPARRPDPVANGTSSPTPSISNDELDGLLEGETATGAEQEAAYRLQKPSVRPPSVRSAPAPPPTSRLDAAFKQKQSRSGTWIMGLLVVVLLCSVGLAAFMVAPGLIKSWQQRNVQLENLANRDDDQSSRNVLDAENSPIDQGGSESFLELFGGENPFNNLSAGIIVLDEIGGGAKSDPVLLLVEDPSKLQVSLSTEDGKLLIHEDETENDHRWNITVDEEAVGCLVIKAKDGEGCNLYWESDGRLIEDDTFRSAAYDFNGTTFTLVAPSNERPAEPETISLTINLPMLFDGKHPLHAIPETENETPFLWEADPAKDQPKQIVYCYSPDCIMLEEKKVSSVSSVTIAEGPFPDKKQWSVSLDGIALGAFVATSKGDEGVQLCWEWKQTPPDEDKFQRAKYLLRDVLFELAVRREDLPLDMDTRTLTLSFPHASPFIATKPNSNDQWLLPLPNPTRVTELPNKSRIRLRLPQPDKLKLKLHPGFMPLIKTPGRTLILKKNPDSRKWTISVEDPGAGASITLGTYSLSDVDSQTDEYQLGFSWTAEAKREVAAAELVRWCPLIVESQDERRLYLQREPDEWVIPPWDRQKGFVMESGFSNSENHTGQEFTDLDLSTSRSAILSVSVTDVGDFEENVTRATTHVSRYFRLKAPLQFMDEAPENEEYGVIEFQLTLPTADTGSAHFGLETNVSAFVRLPRLTARHRSSPSDGEHIPLLRKLLTTDPSVGMPEKWEKDIQPFTSTDGLAQIDEVDLVGLVSFPRVKKEMDDQSLQLMKLIRDFRKELDKRRRGVQKKLMSINPGTNENEFKRYDREQFQWEKRAKLLKDLEKRYGTDKASGKNPYESKTDKLLALRDVIETLRMSMSLSVELPGKPKVRITF
ncbi:MAG: hypothetical protein ABGZ53_31675, partial [Fuerstiella sp.]